MQPSAERVIEAFQIATDENLNSSIRNFNLVNLPAEGELWMTGDLHDHRRNYEKVVRHAALDENPQRHLVLHELIHGDRFDSTGAEGSWHMLFEAAELKCDFPEQVHFLLANHDLAQIHGEGIMKAGLSVCEAFSAGVKQVFNDQSDKVEIAMKEFLLSLPLGIQAPNGIFCCHSLPTDSQIEKFDFNIFHRPLTGPDYARRTGPVYQLIWGRHMSPATAAAFAEKVEAKVIITGHQPQEEGYLVNGPHHLILASDHNQGVFLPMDLSETYDMDGLVARIQKFASLEQDVEQAVIVHLPLDDEQFGSKRRRDALFALEDKLMNTVEAVVDAEFDGNEFGEGECTFYMYGPDTDAIYQAILPLLRELPITKGGYARPAILMHER